MSQPSDEVIQLRDRIGELTTQRDTFEELLGEAEEYVQHRATCARLLTKKDCDCGLVEFMTRMHEELGEDEDDSEEDEEDEDDKDRDE